VRAIRAFGSHNAIRSKETPRDTRFSVGKKTIRVFKRMTFNNTAKVLSILMLATPYGAMAAGACIPAAGVTCPGIDDTFQYILNLVNTEAGATQSLQVGERTWTYSMALAGPCTLFLTEELQWVNTAGGSSPTKRGREITHYLIPLSDLNVGPLGTRLELDRPGVMQVIIATQNATIRRWYGDSATMPPDAPVVYEAPIRFGKPYVDIFVVSVRLDDALRYIAPLCRAR